MFLIVVVTFGCKSYEERALTKLDSNSKKLNAPYVEKHSLLFNGEFISVNELRFNNKTTALLAKKVMFDQFGMWDEKYDVVDEEDRISYLLWKNRRLIPTHNQNFSVIVGSEESFGKMFGSFIILDSNGMDALKNDSPYKNVLIKFFTNLIRKNESSKRDFYNIYHSVK